MSVEAFQHPQNPAVSVPPQDFNSLLTAVGQYKDRAAFAVLYEYFAPRIKSFLIKGGAAPDAAEELAQETMLIIWQRAGTFDPARASASTWIFTIARNKRIDSLRRIHPLVELNDNTPLPDDAPAASETVSAHQETEIMADALKRLPEEQASLLFKSFFEDKSHADIAKEAGLPLGTVKSRIRLALEKLGANGKIKELWT